MLMKLAPASVATALASRVFPVPGGPNNNTPLQGCPTSHQLSDQTWSYNIKHLSAQMAKVRSFSTLKKVELHINKSSTLNGRLVRWYIFTDMFLVTRVSMKEVLNRRIGWMDGWMDTRVRFPLENSSGRCKGSITSSLRALFTFSRAPMWSNFTPTSFGGITAEINAFSYSSSATVCHLHR